MTVLKLLLKEDLEQYTGSEVFTVWYSINNDPKTQENLTKESAKFFCEALENSRIWDYTLYQVLES